MKEFRGGAFVALFLVLVGAGCATGRVMNLPGELERPVMTGVGGPAAPAASPTVAVLDFAWDAPASQEIGRNFDSVKPIVWKGHPGKALADLFSAVLREKGIPAVRVAGEGAVPRDASVRVTGRVEEFRVDGKKANLLKAENVARVVLTVTAASSAAAGPWTTRLSADYWDSEAFFVTPEGLRDAMNGAANAAAEEAARRLIASGIMPGPAPAPGGSAGPGQPGSQ